MNFDVNLFEQDFLVKDGNIAKGREPEGYFLELLYI